MYELLSGKPFNDLPLLPPKAEIETPAVLKKVIAADMALAELKGLVNVIPNQGILINTLILNEAGNSSEIENIITTRDRLYQVYSKELVEALFHLPYCKIRFLEEHGITKQQAASEYLKALDKIGILDSRKMGKENLYLNK